MNEAGIKEVKSKGFRKAWWQANRSSKCKGSGVGKALDKLEKLGVAPSGLPTGVKDVNAEAAMLAYDDLSSALLRAKGKCGGMQQETALAIDEYRKVVKVAYPKVQGMARKLKGLSENADKELKAKLEKISTQTAQVMKVAGQIHELCLKGLRGLEAIYNKHQPGEPTTQYRRSANALLKNTKLLTAEKEYEAKVFKPLQELQAQANDAPPTPANDKLRQQVILQLSRAREQLRKYLKTHPQAIAAYQQLLKDLPPDGETGVD